MLSALVGGCERSATTDAPVARLKQRQQQQSPAVVTLKYPAASLVNVPLVALDGSLKLADRVSVVSPSNEPAGAAQLGAAAVELGAQAESGSLIVQGNVLLRTGARVQGDVSTAGSLTTQQGAEVTGDVAEQAGVTPHNEESIPVPLVSEPNAPVSLEPDEVQSLNPGAYGSLAVKGGARLELAAGDYAFTSVMIEPGAVLELDDAVGPVRWFVDSGLTFRGQVRSESGDPPAFLVVHLGTQALVIDAAFQGTLVAPNGPLVLGPGAQPHEGAFFGKSIEVRPDTRIIYRPYFRLEAVEQFGVASPSTGPFANPAFDPEGGFLLRSTDTVFRVSDSGAVSEAFVAEEPQRFGLGPSGQRFLVSTIDELEVRSAAGSLITTLPREPAGYGKLVPETELVFLPEVGLDPERPRVSHARFYSPSALVSRFPAPGLLISRLTSNHLVYATMTELVRTSLSGVEAWRLPIRLANFELSYNGELAIGLLKAEGRSEVVVVDISAGSVLGSWELPGTLWNLAVAPGGRYAAANTQNRVYLFDRGELIKEFALPVEWCVSLDINDQGSAVVGAQLLDHTSRLYLLGGPAAGVWSQDRAVETTGYRPSARFTPGGQQFTLNETSGLTQFEIRRTF